MIFKWLKNKKEAKETKKAMEEFHSFASQEIRWTDSDGSVQERATIVLQTNQNGDRKVKIMKSKDNLNSPEDHPWYHSIVIPFLERTGYGQYDNLYVIDTLKQHIYGPHQEPMAQKKNEKPQPKASSEGNIIIFPKDKK